MDGESTTVDFQIEGCTGVWDEQQMVGSRCSIQKPEMTTFNECFLDV